MLLPNVWVLLSSVVFSIVLGFIWYGPLFGKKWMELSGIQMPNPKPSMMVMIKPMLLSAIGTVLLTYVLASLITFHNTFYNTSGYVTALSFAFFIWLGLSVPPYLNLSGWEQKSWTLFFINTGYWLVLLLAISALIVALP